MKDRYSKSDQGDKKLIKSFVLSFASVISKMATRQKNFFDEERIAKLVKEISEKEFKKQEVNMKIISNNFILPMKETKSLKEEVTDQKKSMEFTQNDLEQKVADVEKKILHV